MVPNKDKVYQRLIFRACCITHALFEHDMIRMIRIHGVKKALTHISVKLVTHAVVSKWRGIYHAYIARFAQKINVCNLFLFPLKC